MFALRGLKSQSKNMYVIELTTHIHNDNHNELTVYVLYFFYLCMNVHCDSFV